MNRTTFGKAALSSLLVATTMVGCSGAAFKASPSAAVSKEKQDAGKLAAAAERALGSRAFDSAVQSAEAAVALQPDNAAFRQILGRSYVASGRFLSAETALTDAMTLGNSDARTIVSLALVQVALGKSDAARTLLAAHTDTLPAADYGLAIAMAGDPQEGVRILSAAIHDPSANARTRQNLAYAYALSGRWKDARVMVGEDVEPLAANQRISQWAMIADPSLAAERVATLMGVTINSADAGQPLALALGATAAPVAMADASANMPAAIEIPAATAPVAVAAVEVAPATPTVIETAEAAPVIRALATPVRSAEAPVPAKPFAVEAPKAKVKAPAAAQAATPQARIQQAAFLKPATTGASNWVVQLGAYDTAAIAKEKWLYMASVNSGLAAFPVLTSQATVKGKPFHRLAVSGFGTRADALAMCKSIQSNRGQCFVREGAPGATPQRWAVASRGRQFASR